MIKKFKNSSLINSIANKNNLIIRFIHSLNSFTK